ncbi:PLP-dependent aminotransferase family protein [Halomonas daqingensis]|uniref:PLP-dependent aminotransferase family protein n=1 Tax=Billgrantia desiderata TaxID=52021 RepID=A0ABS9B8K1_9GAMM|nr:PLP-dependent aminotransferase family protein [Halomonas desiderata]MCE8043500.1 PLP-dependent aminotransferase family protein [Halomonas desiderata]MCE8048074.1 PLP-dependent aminotransferase family protein [Halomonas desiderata]
MSQILFHLDSSQPTSLQQQLREQIVHAILDGHIPLDEALPSSRKLARELQVARNTVMLAYEQLLDDGYLIARSRSGYYVNPNILEGRAEKPIRLNDIDAERMPWEELLTVRPSLQESIRKPSDWHRYDYPFLYGQLDPSLFPTQHWRECSRDSMSVPAIRSWSVDHLSEDDPLLVEQIHQRLLPRRGVWAKPEEILVTVGTQQALWIAAMLLLKPGRQFGMENPGYVDMYNIARLFTDDIRLLPVDEQGMRPIEKLTQCQLVYTTPSHQSPTTVTMPLERRRQLLDMAEIDNFLIIEDDYDSETNYLRNPTPALKSLDRHDRVIYVGSLSKTLAPGLRLGYMVAHPTLIREARALRRLMLRHPPTNNQRALALFLDRGYHDALIRQIHQTFHDRWECMSEALRRHLPDCFTPSTYGGSCFWIRGPEGLDCQRLQLRAREDGILLERGDIHYFDRPGKEYLRLGFSAIPEEKIEPGLERLARLLPHAIVAP